MHVVIVGGGIGGLALAIGLSRENISSVVLEQSSRYGEIGAGIQLGPNAFNCFDSLGIGDAARNGAVFIDRLQFMDAVTEKPIAHIPLDDTFRKRFGNPYAVVHRADLHKTLLDVCKASNYIELRTEHKVNGYQQDEHGVDAIVNGEVLRGDVLVGADGLRSAIRHKLIGDGEPIVSGHTTYRCVIPAKQMPKDLRWNAATLWAGPKCHLVHYPLKGGDMFNLVVTCHNDAAEAVAGKPVSEEEVRQSFAHIADQPKQLIEHGTNWKLWVLCDREPNSNWVDKRVTLLGDAAHPMLQYMAQGACMALEDAVCLSQSLAMYSGNTANSNNIEAALNIYRGERVPRTTRLQVYSRLMGEYIYHPDDAKAMLRDSVMQTMSAEDYFDKLQWLYGGP